MSGSGTIKITVYGPAPRGQSLPLLGVLDVWAAGSWWAKLAHEEMERNPHFDDYHRAMAVSAMLLRTFNGRGLKAEKAPEFMRRHTWICDAISFAYQTEAAGETIFHYEGMNER